MAVDAASLLRIVLASLAMLLVASAMAWGAFALWFQASGGRVMKALLVLSWAALSLGCMLILGHGRMAIGFLLFASAFAGLLLWWRRILPSNARTWADDVAQMATGTIDGELVTLHHVRNFDWRSATDYTPRWEARSYDLGRLRSVDMIMSYWTFPAIAHMLISFGFEPGEHVVFSVEIRREKTEKFSEIGGFFKEFELSIIAADERDVIRVRTNVRGEEDYLYRLCMPVSAMRSLFLAYVEEANELMRTPRFYNTITVNCTTLVYHMMNRIVGYLPLNYRLMFSGYLPAYVYRVGGLDQRYSLEQLRSFGRITERARAAPRSDDFSARIRDGIPEISTPPQPPTRPARQYSL